jgi:hypothetical protein
MATLIRDRARVGASITDALQRAFTFDVVTSESHEVSADATEHTVEGASPITDHIQLKQKTLALSGVVTNTPIIVDALTPSQRARVAYETIVEMMERAELVTVVTGLTVYENMAIVQVSSPRDPKSSRNELQVSIQLKQIRITSPEFVEIDPSLIAEEVRDSAEDETNTGSEEEETTPEEEEETNQSILYGLGLNFDEDTEEVSDTAERFLFGGGGTE